MKPTPRGLAASLHVIGHSDGVISPRESHALADQFDGPIVLTHPGGHVVPGDPAIVDGVVRFLDRMRATR